MIWFKHPNNLPNDKRLATLIDKEGSRGYGMYLYIIEMLCAQPDGKLCFSQLKIMARKGFPRKYMEKIIREYRLFILCGEEEFESAIDFNSKEKANHLQNDLKTSAKTVHAENEDKRLNNSGSTEKTRLARVRRDKNREEEIKRKDDVVVQKRDDDDDDAFAESCNDVSSESCRNETPDNNSRNDARHSCDDSHCNDDFYRCDKDIHGSNVSENSKGAFGNSKGTPGNSPFSNGTPDNNSRNNVSHSCDNETHSSNVSENSNGIPGNGKGASGNSKGTSANDTSTTPYTSWEKQVDDLSKNRTFRELVCMKSSFSILLDRHFDAALEEFKKHIILLGKEEKMDSREEVRSYFTYYTQAGRRTSHELRMRLLELDARRQADAPLDLYRYEQLVDGKRIYLGCPIPDEAPPRPNSNAFWNEVIRSWVS